MEYIQSGSRGNKSTTGILEDCKENWETKAGAVQYGALPARQNLGKELCIKSTMTQKERLEYGHKRKKKNISQWSQYTSKLVSQWSQCGSMHLSVSDAESCPVSLPVVILTHALATTPRTTSYSTNTPCSFILF